jgi:hypothetical protein
MSMSVSVNELPSPKDRTKAYGNAVIGVLIAVGLVCLLVNAMYLSSLDGPVELGKDVGQFFVGP